MRLTAFVYLELDLRMLGLQLGDEAGNVRLVVAREEGHHAARLGEEALDDLVRDVVEIRAYGDGLTFGEAEELARADREAVQLRVLRRNRDRAGRDCTGDLGH